MLEAAIKLAMWAVKNNVYLCDFVLSSQIPPSFTGQLTSCPLVKDSDLFRYHHYNEQFKLGSYICRSNTKYRLCNALIPVTFDLPCLIDVWATCKGDPTAPETADTMTVPRH